MRVRIPHNTGRSQWYSVVVGILLTMLIAMTVLAIRHSVYSNHRRECNSILMYYDLSEKAVCLYTEHSGYPPIYSGEDTGGFPLGYDEPSHSFVSLVAATYPDYSIITICGEQKKESIVRNLPRHAMCESAKLCGGRVYIPAIENGALVLYGYGFDGRLKEKRVLRVPGAQLGSVPADVSIDVAPNGYVAAELARVGSEGFVESHLDDYQWSLFVFNSNGKVIREISDGSQPCFSSDCKSIAYSDNDPSTNRARIVITNILTRRTRTFDVWPPEDPTNLELREAEMFCTFKWDSDNKWLFVNYEGGSVEMWPIHAIDISSDDPAWHTLPISGNHRSWILLDEMPSGIGN